MLVVCSGNICRSPMVEACLRERLARDGVHGVEIDSAGLLGIEDAPAAPEAQAALREVGIDLSGHRSKGLLGVDLLCADVVVVMTQEHLCEIDSRFRRWSGERWVLRAFERGPVPDADAPDLEDPIGEPVELYREQLVIVRRCVEHLASYLATRTVPPR